MRVLVKLKVPGKYIDCDVICSEMDMEILYIEYLMKRLKEDNKIYFRTGEDFEKKIKYLLG